ENNNLIRADANVSIKESGFVKTEVKNITGFKEIERAVNYEIERQKLVISEGKKLIQETRAWDYEKGISFSLRKKETEEDYGYIIDTDLVSTEITKGWVEKIKQDMPELAQDKIQKFVKKHKISKEDAIVLSQEKLLADLFEKVAEEINPILAARWLRRELMRVLNYTKKSLHDLEIDESHLIDLLKLVESKKITDNIASKLMEKLIEKPFDVKEYVKKENLEAVSDKKEIEKYCIEAVKENPQAVEDYKKSEKKALNFIVGQVMRKTRGKATPKEVNEIIKSLIK
ncbi:MAG: Asp-tRNA(Asn)/Glu-tRNA(Gln) amidotransferase GatCAB subunit B, partial [Bacteroidetes bacterium]|nr:Asp-tRNA(Asn)/Glu-tRNA(Gln) amidotransferase GatCAB subunit B [Bacteroidota bacterium]